METKYENGSCNSCGCENVPVVKTKHRFVGTDVNDDTEIELCEICYTTHASKPYFYPRNGVSNGDVLTVLAQIGNIIRKDIKSLEK